MPRFQQNSLEKLSYFIFEVRKYRKRVVMEDFSRNGHFWISYFWRLTNYYSPSRYTPLDHRSRNFPSTRMKLWSEGVRRDIFDISSISMFVELDISEGTGTGDTFWGNCNEYRFITLLVVKKNIYTYTFYIILRQLLKAIIKGNYYEVYRRV